MPDPSDPSKAATVPAAAALSVRLTDLVGRFDGHEDFAEWIKKFELVMKRQSLTELETVLPLFLSGDAFAVFDAMDSADKASYGQIKSALTTAFSLETFSAYEAFVGRRFRQGETVDVYLADLRRLARLVHSAPSEEWIKAAFVFGLPEQVKIQLKAATSAKTTALSELVERARMILSVTGTAAMVARTGELQNPGGRDTRGERKDSTRRYGRRCFVCSDPTHIARNCPQRLRQKTVTCFYCGKEGHRIAECPDHGTPSSKNV